jgi:type I restriction enzyme S subunit
MISLKFIPLTFITSNDEIVKQIKNTVVFSHLFETCKETTFNDYIETTQYGFTASALEKGSHRMLRITDIHHSKVNWESVPFCDCQDDEKYLLKDNDILIARTGGTTGKSFFVENPPSNAVFASYLIRIRLKKDMNIEFINAFLNSYCFWSQIVEMKGGSAQPNVNAEKLKVLIMPDCDLETQEKTVRLLKDENNSEFEDIRERINFVESLFWNNNQITTELSKQLELLRQLRQAFLREAMQGKIVPQDKADEPAEILLERIRAEKEKLIAEKKIRKENLQSTTRNLDEETLYEIPENWVWCKLGEICNLITDGTHHTPTYITKGIPFLSVKNISNGFLDFSDTKFISVEEHNHLIERCNPEFGDVLLTKVGTTGIAKVINVKKDFSIFVSVALLKFNLELTYNKFLEFVINSPFVKQQSDDGTWGVGNKNLVLKTIKQFSIPLPPLAEQKRIVEKLEKLMNFCDELEQNIRHGHEQTKSLLQVSLKEALQS